MRRAALVLLALVLAGCGLGEGDERSGAGAQLRVTRDFGRTVLGEARVDKVRDDQTVMRLLRSEFDVGTRFGGRFVQSIDGLVGSDGGQVAWFYWVNGIEAGVGAAEYELSPGDRVQWDRRDWGAAMRVPAIVGAFPEPFEHGEGGRRRPVRVECDDARTRACEVARERLRAAGIGTSGASLGAPGVENVIRVVVAPWSEARRVKVADRMNDGPDESGVFARFADDGRELQLLDADGRVARTVRSRTGVVAALRPNEEELVWLVTGLDEEGVEAAAGALSEARLRDAFAVAVTGGEVEKLPLEGE